MCLQRIVSLPMRETLLVALAVDLLFVVIGLHI